MRTIGRAAVFLMSSLGAVVGATSRAQAQAPPPLDSTVWNASLGAVLNTGNTRSWSVSAASHLSIKRSRNVVSADLQLVYGQASVRNPMTGQFGDWTFNAGNLNARARYDRFFTKNDAAFGAVVFRRDTFAGLDGRVQVQVGYLRNFYNDRDKQRLWGELGYDFTYDNFYPDPLIDPATMSVLPGEQFVHSIRAFVGYDNHLSEAVTFLTGIEALFDMLDGANVRLNWVSQLNSKISGRLQFGLNFTLRFDNVPVPGTGNLDTVTTVNLLYSLL